jgi:hypothetical protein
MVNVSPVKLMLLGFLMMVFGVAVPLFTILKLLPLEFWLNILSYFSSTFGLMIGLAGAVLYIQTNKPAEPPES